MQFKGVGYRNENVHSQTDLNFNQAANVIML